MHTLIEKLFRKRGIEDTTKLSTEEAATFDRWEKILSEGEISVEKIADFCKMQVKIIENQWKALGNRVIKNERLVMLHTVYSTILDVISSPKAERENLEKYLNGLLQEP